MSTTAAFVFPSRQPQSLLNPFASNQIRFHKSLRAAPAVYSYNSSGRSASQPSRGGGVVRGRFGGRGGRGQRGGQKELTNLPLPLWPTVSFTKNPVSLAMEWVQKNKPKSFPPVFRDKAIEEEMSLGAPMFIIEMEVEGIGRVRGQALESKSAAKESACVAWLQAYVGRYELVSLGWLQITVPDENTAEIFRKEIYGFGKVGKIRQTLQLLSCITATLHDNGIPVNTHAAPVFQAVLGVLSQAGKWQESLNVVTTMQKCRVPVDTRVYNMLITSCERAGEWQRAIPLLREITKAGLEADVYSYNACLAALSSGGSFDGVMELLKEMKAQGIERDQFSYGSAIKVCERCHRWEAAVALVQEMRTEAVCISEFAYSAAIGACGVCGETDQALELLRLMIEDGCKPTVYSYSGVLTGLRREKRWEECLQLLIDMKANGIAPSIVNINQTLAVLAEARQWKKAVELFQSMEEDGLTADIYTFNTVLDSLQGANQPNLVMNLFQELRLRGKQVGDGKGSDLRPDSITCTAIVKALVGSSRPDLALKVFDILRREGLRADLQAFNGVISACAEIGEAAKALQYLIEMERETCPDLCTYNTLIKVMDASGEGAHALALLRSIEEVGLKPDAYSYNCAISACRHLKGREGYIKAKEITAQMKEKYNIKPSEITYNTMILVCGKAKLWNEAMDLFNSMAIENGGPGRTSDSYHHMLSALNDCKWDTKIALELLERAKKEDIHVGIGTYNTAIQYCKFEGGYQIYQHMITAGVQPDVQIFNTLLQCAVFSSEPSSVAHDIRKDMKAYGIEANLGTFAQIVALHAENREWDDALHIIEKELIDEGLEANVSIYNKILSSCGKFGQVKLALSIMDRMRLLGLTPTSISYSHVIKAYTNCVDTRPLGSDSILQEKESDRFALIDQ